MRHGFDPSQHMGYNEELLNSILRHIPSWHACLTGPQLDPDSGPLKCIINNIFADARDEAEVLMWTKVEMLCGDAEVDFAFEDWDVDHLVMSYESN